MQFVEDPGYPPSLQAPLAGLAGAASQAAQWQLRRPRDPGVEHKRDALQAWPVAHWSGSGRVLGPGRRTGSSIVHNSSSLTHGLTLAPFRTAQSSYRLRPTGIRPEPG